MAKLYGPGGKELFQALAGIIDFYYYKGQLCARSLPQHCSQPGTPAQLITWEAMRTRVAAYRSLSRVVIDGFKRLALGSDKTWVDVFTTVWLKAYNKYGYASAYLYDTQVEELFTGFRLWVKVWFPCYVRERYYTGEPKDKPWLWRWDYTQEPEPPPNCRKKGRLREDWPSERFIGPVTAHEWTAFPVVPRASTFGRWYTIDCKPLPVREYGQRSGVWHYGQGY